MKELADFLTALGRLLAALDRGAGQEQPAAALNLPQAEPVTDCNRLPAAETVTDSHHLPEAPAAEEPVGNPDTLPNPAGKVAETLPQLPSSVEKVAETTENSVGKVAEQKPKKKPWTCVCTCQHCGSEFTASRREAKCCPSCRSAIRREHMSKVRKAYLEKLQQPAPAPQEDAGTEPAAGGE